MLFILLIRNILLLLIIIKLVYAESILNKKIGIIS